MRLARYLDRIIPDFSAALLRFPVPALYAILLGLLLNIVDLGGSPDAEVWLAASAGFLAAGAGHLFAEGRALPRVTNILIALGAGVAAHRSHHRRALAPRHQPEKLRAGGARRTAHPELYVYYCN